MSMIKIMFKVGDEVVVTADLYEHNVGDIRIISAVDQHVYWQDENAYGLEGGGYINAERIRHNLPFWLTLREEIT